ncbi:uncharacterized protein RSE6_04928 [Rhynchosporium secalis]|uniref:Uncharacterized protein n=1 Tax=Rhynchosporium secalis TaxID=38038 RepID=A0A1E1M6I2_RHYSE|nr:uncharacterized protein RSE6_04928 [Rhynchosporium secalis]
MEVNVVVELSLSRTPSQSCELFHDLLSTSNIHEWARLNSSCEPLPSTDWFIACSQLVRMKLGCEPSSSPRFTTYLSFTVPTERKMNQPSDEFSLNSYAFASFVYLHIHPFGKKKRSKDQKTYITIGNR